LHQGFHLVDAEGGQQTRQGIRYRGQLSGETKTVDATDDGVTNGIVDTVGYTYAPNTINLQSVTYPQSATAGATSTMVSYTPDTDGLTSEITLTTALAVEQKNGPRNAQRSITMIKTED